MLSHFSDIFEFVILFLKIQIYAIVTCKSFYLKLLLWCIKKITSLILINLSVILSISHI